MKSFTSFISIFVGCFVGLAVADALLKSANKNDVKSPAAIHKQFDVDEFANTVIQMPDGAFKSNLLTVIASEYSGSSEELNALLKKYSEIKIKELSKQKEL